MTSIDLSALAQRRYTCKHFDASKKIPTDHIEQIKTLLRLSPSSVNSQPWHFIIADSKEGKERIAKSTAGPAAYNTPKVIDCSHIVAICSRVDINAEHQAAILAQEDKDGRFQKPEYKTGQGNSRRYYTNLHIYESKDLQAWMEKQVYISLGMLMLGATALGIDSCAMEGFDRVILDKELQLQEKGFTSLVLVALGYAAPTDANATLKKSRLAPEKVFTIL